MKIASSLSKDQPMNNIKSPRSAAQSKPEPFPQPEGVTALKEKVSKNRAGAEPAEFQDSANSSRRLPDRRRNGSMIKKAGPPKQQPKQTAPQEQARPGGRRNRNDIRAELAQKGDLLGLFRSISAADNELIIIRSTEFARLFRVARMRAQRNPLGCVREILSYGVGLLSYIALRQGCHLENVTRRDDGFIKSGSETALRDEVIQNLVPAFNQTINQLAELGVQQAFIERQQELTRAKRLENDRTEAICGAGRHSQNGSALTQSPPSSESNGKASRAYSDAQIEERFTCPTMNEPFLRSPSFLELPPKLNGHATHRAS
jgi:hypothetical protein